MRIYLLIRRRLTTTVLLLVAVNTLILVWQATPVHAAAFTWDGGGSDNNWSTSLNWDGNSTPANDGTADLTFNGMTQTNPSVDTPWFVSSISFDDAVVAGNFTIAGSDITFSTATGVTNNSAAAHTINANLISDAAGLSLTGTSEDLVIGGGIDLSAGGGATLTIDGAQDTTVSGAITGTNAAIVKNGAGAVTIDGMNTFTGTVTLNAGTLIANPNSEMSPSVTMTFAGGTFQNSTGMELDIDQPTTISGDVTLAGPDAIIVLGNVDLAGGTRTLTITNTDEVEVAAIISNGGAVKDGPGFLILSGNNAYTGGSTLSGGTLGLANDNALGTGTLTISDGTTIVGMDGNRTITNPILVTGNFTVADDPNADPMDLPVATLYSGTVDLNGATRTITVTVAEEVEFEGVISNGGLVIDGSGFIILTGNNLYAGGTTLNGATVGLAHDDALGSGVVTIGDGAVLAPVDANRMIGNTLTVTGNFSIDGDPDPGVPTFDLDLTAGFDLSADRQITVTSNAVGRISGAITESGGSRSLTKTGPGELILSGTNTYTGTTTVSGGSLTLNGSNAIADTAAMVLADATGVDLALDTSETIGSLAGGGAGGGNVDLGVNTLTLGDASTTVFAGVISGTGGLVKQGSGELALTAANTYTGHTMLNTGTLALGHNQALGTGGLTLGNGVTLRGIGMERDISNPITVAGDFTLTGDGTLDFDGAVDLGGATRTITVGTGDDSALAGVISNGGIIKQGTGILLVDGTNTYAGGTTLSGGTLGIGNDDALGTGGLIIEAGTSVMAIDANRTVGNALTINGDFSIIEDTEAGPFELTLTGNATLAADRQVTVAGGVTAELTGVISGVGGLTKDGAGTLTLSGANTYTGNTTVNNGTLALDGVNAIDDAGAVSLADTAGTTLRIDASETIGSIAGGGINGGDVHLTSGTLTVGDANDTVFGGVITGAGSLAKQGTGVLTLQRPSTYAGGTTLNAGTLAIGDNAALGTGTLTIGNGTTVHGVGIDREIANNVIVAGDFTISNDDIIDFSGTVDLGGTTRVITLGAGGDSAMIGVVANGGIDKQGSGLLILVGNNTYASGTKLSGGSLELAHDNALGTGSLTINNGTTLVGLDANRNIANAMTINGNFTIDGDTDPDPGDPDIEILFSGNVDLGAGTRTITVNTNTLADVELAGVVSNGGLVKDGPGLLILTGNNTHTGGTTLNRASLGLAHDNALGTGSLTIENGTTVVGIEANRTITNTLTVNGNFTIDGDPNPDPGTSAIELLFAGNVDLGAVIRTINVNNNSLEQVEFAGVVSNGGLVLGGNGHVVLSGNNVYAGGTTLNGAMLGLAHDNALGMGGVIIGDGTTLATLDANRTIGNTLTVTGDFTIMGDPNANPGDPALELDLTAGFDLSADRQITVTSNATGQISGAITESGGSRSLTKTGPGQLILSGTNTYTGTTTVSGGSLTLDGSNAIADIAAVVLADAAGVALNLNASETIGSLAGGGATGGNVDLGVNTLTVNNTANTTFAGVISGTGNLVKDGAGILTIDGVNTFTGTLTLNAGTLVAGPSSGMNPSVTLTLAGGALQNDTGMELSIDQATTVSGNAILAGADAILFTGTLDLAAGTRTLTVTNTDEVEVMGAISNGGLVKDGPGFLILTGNNTYAGGTTLSGGTLELAHDNALGTGSLTINNGTTLVGLDANRNIANAMTINGDFTIDGDPDPGTPVLDLALTGDFTLSATRQITVTPTITGTLAGVISGAGGLTKDGAGTLTLAGANTYAGNTTVNNGTLLVGDDAALGTGALTVATGTTFGAINGTRTITNAMTANGDFVIAGTDNLTLNGTISGTGGLTKQGSGSLTLGATNTYTGTTTISGGTLVLNGGNAIADTAAVVMANTAGAILALGSDETIGSLVGGGTSGGNMNLGSNTLTVGDGTDTTYSGVISGAGGLVKQGSGNLALTSTNAFAGSVNHTAGTLSVGHSSALGTGGLTLTDGVAIGAVGTPVQISNPLTIGTAFTIDGDQNLTLTDDLTLASNLSVTISGSGRGILTGDVSGGFELTKLGVGTLELTGANTYTGDTNINAGILLVTGSIDNSAIQLNGGQLVLGPNGSASGNLGVGDGSALSAGDQDNEIANDLDITGNFQIDGDKDLTLSGNLNLGGAVRQIDVQDPNNNTDVTSPISGTGGITKAGAGTLELSGANTFTGGTTLSDGTLVISGSVTGSTTVSGGTLALANDNALGTDLTISGGNLESRGGSRTIPSAVMVTVNADFGVTGNDNLEIAANVALPATRTITAASTGDTVLSGVISGSGGLTKAGSGRMVLAANNTYSGSTDVDAGTLVLSGAVAGDVMVNAAGTLEGSGTINGNVVVSGVFNAGRSPGTMVIGGNMTLNTSSTTVVEIASVSLADFYDVGGSASLDGTLRVVQLPGYVPTDSNTFTIIDADGGITGTFATLDASPAGLSYDISYNANDVVIEMTTIPYANSAVTPNQTGVASVIDTIRLTATGDWATVTNALNQLTPSQLQAALDQIVPEEVGALSNISFGGSSIQAANVSARMAEVRLGATGSSARNLRFANLSHNVQEDLRLMALATRQPLDHHGYPQSLADDHDWSFFASGAGHFGDIDSTSSQAGYDFTTGGITLGADRRINDHLILGFATGYANSNVYVDSDGGEVDVNSAKIGVYGSYFRQAFYVDGMIGGGYHDYDADRRIHAGALTRTATSSPEGLEFNLMVGGGYDLDYRGMKIGPTVRLMYNRLSIDKYTESGAGALNLQVDRQTAESLVVQVGARVATMVEAGGLRLIPELRASFQHEFEDQGRSVTARFASGGGGAFGFNTTDIGSDSAVIGAGVTLIGTHNAASFIDYNVEVGRRDYVAHSIRGGIQFRF